MLKTEHLTITTHRGRVLLQDFSFVLNRGDKIALIGEEGNGKSTILKILAGKKTDSYVRFSGQVLSDGRIAYLPQDPGSEAQDKSVITYIDDPIDYNQLYLIMNRIGIDPELIDDRPFETLSGGERVKIALLKILYEQPDILLLDEPSNDLDLKTLIWLEEFICNTRLPLIFVSHDEQLLQRCANGILHLEQLKRKSEAHMTFERKTYEEYLNDRMLFVERNNMIAAKEKAQFNRQLEKWRKIYQKVEYRQNIISRKDPHGGQLLKKKMHAVKAQGRNLEKKKENLTQTYEPEEAIDIFFEEVELNPGKVILDLSLDELKTGEKVLSGPISLHVSGKDKMVVIGENGCGKSTLIKYIFNQLKDRSDISLGYMPQDYGDQMDEHLKVLDFLWDGASLKERSRITTFLGSLKFTAEEMEHRISDLSQGQKCKIFLAKMILQRNNVLLLDEPTRNLSPLSGPRLRQILRDFGGCIISVSHDRKFISEVADQVYELDEDGLRRIE